MAQILRFLLMERLLIASYNLGFSHMELVRRQEGVDSDDDITYLA
jgi:hypothetical protein